MADDDDWFAHKRFGMGPGLPISWQGWALTVGYIAIVAGTVVGFHDRPEQFVAVLIPVTLVFLTVSARRTRGGWRWRWGGDE